MHLKPRTPNRANLILMILPGFVQTIQDKVHKMCWQYCVTYNITARCVQQFEQCNYLLIVIIEQHMCSSKIMYTDDQLVMDWIHVIACYHNGPGRWWQLQFNFIFNYYNSRTLKHQNFKIEHLTNAEE